MGHSINAATIIGITTFFLVLCTAFTVIRFYERIHRQQQLWWDDWTMLLAWVATVALCLLQFLMLRDGAGVDVSRVPESQFKEFSMLFLDIQPIARVSILFAKLSILLLYLRIFFPAGTRKTTLWWLIHLTIWVNILYTVALTLATVLQCVPYGLPWGKTCINQYLVLILSSTINIISDIAVLIIPLGSIWALQMTQQVKWAVWALFAFGALAPLASIARLAYQIPNADSENKTVVYPTLLILATAEQVVAMVGGSIPIASATILRLLRGNSRSGSGQSPSYKRSTSQHIWPGREGHVRLPWRASDRHGSFALNDTLLVGSEEVLYPEEAYRSRDIELERTLSRSDASSGIR